MAIRGYSRENQGVMKEKLEMDFVDQDSPEGGPQICLKLRKDVGSSN